MDPNENPFSPGAGSPPYELVGRESILEQAQILLRRTKNKRPEKSIILTGLRGVGKTVLLNEIKYLAEKESYRTIFIEIHENKSFGPLIAPFFKTLLFELNRFSGFNNKIKRGLAVLKSFISALKITIDGTTFGLEIEPEKGAADSGDLEIDLPNLFIAVAEAAEASKSAIILLADEMQYLEKKELGALIMAMHRIQQRQLPLVLVGAGLPTMPGLAGESKSYSERLFSFPKIGALSEAETMLALSKPVQKAGVAFEAIALKEIFKVTNGYPYFLQEWGYHSWNLATASPITLQVVRSATTKAISHLDESFFRARYDRLAPSEKKFLRAMAEFGPGTHRTADIASILNAKISSLGPARSKLIKKGMIYSPTHGDVDFSVPLFSEFMMRVMPEFI